MRWEILHSTGLCILFEQALYNQTGCFPGTSFTSPPSLRSRPPLLFTDPTPFTKDQQQKIRLCTMSTTPAVKHRPQFVESTGFERRVHLSWVHSQKDLTIEMGRGSGDVRSSRPPSASSCEGGRNDRLGRRCRSDRLGVGDVDIGGD